MKKRILSVLLAIAMTLCFAGCKAANFSVQLDLRVP